MSEPLPIGVQSASRPDVRVAIARASAATGVDFDYLLAQAKLESSLDPGARARTSSAAGLYQFTSGTWLQTLDRHAATHGMDWAGSAIAAGRVTDPQLRSQIMALRFDPNASALMAAELANDNKAELRMHLGREPDAAELYLAHFLGSGGARQFLGALAADPGQSAAAVLPQAASANRSIFFEANGAPRTVAGVMELLRGRVSAAMEGGELPDWQMPTGDPTSLAAAQPAVVPGGPIAREFHIARQEAAADSSPSTQGRRSMADTLRTAFAVAGPDGQAAAPAFVRAAYGQLQRFGL